MVLKLNSAPGQCRDAQLTTLGLPQQTSSVGFPFSPSLRQKATFNGPDYQIQGLFCRKAT